MRVYRSIIVWVIAIGLLSSCKDGTRGTQASEPIDSIEVTILKKEVVVKTLSLPGELYPWERAEVFAKVQGYVREIKADIGDNVKRNQVLALIDAPEVVANYARASSDLQAAKSRYQSSLDGYRRVYNASKEKGAISASELERTRNQMLTDSANLEAAKSGASANAQLRDYLTIRAAFDGTITSRNTDAGALVGEGGKPLFVLENSSKLRLRVAVPETYTAALPLNPTISLTVDAQPGAAYPAKFSRKTNMIDPTTRTELWEFEVENARQELKSGMFGNVQLRLQRKESSFVVPQSALVTTLERKFVIRLAEDKAEWVDVRSGISLADRIEIFGDLKEGDQLMTRASDQIKEGPLAVRIKIN